MAPLQHHATIGAHPVIAWHESANLMKAISSAQPLWEKAEKVTIVIGEKLSNEVPDPMLVKELRAKGVVVEVNRFIIGEQKLGEQIRTHALSAHADLLVMGAYSRPHFIEWLLGSPTQDILAHARLPILTHN